MGYYIKRAPLSYFFLIISKMLLLVLYLLNKNSSLLLSHILLNIKKSTIPHSYSFHSLRAAPRLRWQEFLKSLLSDSDSTNSPYSFLTVLVTLLPEPIMPSLEREISWLREENEIVSFLRPSSDNDACVFPTFCRNSFNCSSCFFHLLL